MIDNIPRSTVEAIFSQALNEGFIREEDSSVLIHDLNHLESRISYLKSCFPDSTLHGLAIKSNPLLRILEFARGLGTGVEAATAGEIAIALKTGYRPEQIVFDSPVKTLADLRFALDQGVHVNCDNLEEVARVSRILPTIRSTSTIGIRINPQVGVGAILESSVAGDYSKFGVPIHSGREELEKAFMGYPWLTGVHLHVGSQGCPPEMLVNGAGILYDFALRINRKRVELGIPPIRIFDIGGGLPISYSYDQPAPCMEDYISALNHRAPELFTGTGHKGQGAGHRSQGAGLDTPQRHSATSLHPVSSGWRLITEFGRWVFVNSGFTVSRVEYVKQDPGVKTAMIHVGADLFVRECLNPADWKHEYSVLDSTGKLKEGLDDLPYTLAGPLCFAGDILAKRLRLPAVKEGDYLVIHDTGGYTFSMWSRYNSRQTPRVLGCYNGALSVLKERETLDSVVSFWE